MNDNDLLRAADLYGTYKALFSQYQSLCDIAAEPELHVQLSLLYGPGKEAVLWTASSEEKLPMQILLSGYASCILKLEDQLKDQFGVVLDDSIRLCRSAETANPF